MKISVCLYTAACSIFSVTCFWTVRENSYCSYCHSKHWTRISWKLTRVRSLNTNKLVQSHVAHNGTQIACRDLNNFRRNCEEREQDSAFLTHYLKFSTATPPSPAAPYKPRQGSYLSNGLIRRPRLLLVMFRTSMAWNKFDYVSKSCC
jgi:hypothetical protein